MIIPNSPEALLIAKTIGAKDRQDNATRKTPTAGKRAKIPDGTRRAMYEDWRRGWTLKHVAEYYGYALSTTTRIIKEEREKMTTKEKAPAAVEEPTSAIAKNQDEYTTLDELSKEANRAKAYTEIRGAAVDAVINLLKDKRTSPLFNYQINGSDGEYVLKYPEYTLDIITKICMKIMDREVTA